MSTMIDALETLTPVGRSDTLAQKVRTELKEAVMAGRFAPGEKLTIRSIAGALEVSLTPAREALYNLASEGVLELRPNGSVYVPELTVDRVEELAKIRVALESLASREAVRRMSDAEIGPIVAMNDALIARHESHDYSALIALNWQFHFTLYRASRMEVLVRMIESCWLMTGSYLNVIYPEFAEVSEGITNHQQIVRALERRDADRVATAITTDINLMSDALVNAIEHKKKARKS